MQVHDEEFSSMEIIIRSELSALRKENPRHKRQSHDVCACEKMNICPMGPKGKPGPDGSDGENGDNIQN